jgi:hypothetical protein
MLDQMRSRILDPVLAAAAIRRGIVRAAQDCELWGGDWPTDRGCENLLQVRAAEELFALMRQQGLGQLTLEQSLVDVTYNGTSKRGRRYTGMTDQQRADIAIWTKANEIYGLVEIKRGEADRQWRDDLVKLAKQLKTYCRAQGCHLRYGIFGAYISCPSHAGIDHRGARLTKIAREVADYYGLSARTCIDDVRHRWPERAADGWTCSAGSVVLRWRS